MKKNFMTTLGLAGVLVALVLWYALYEKNYKKTRKESAENVKRLVTLDHKEVQEFEMERLIDPPDEKDGPQKVKNPRYETLSFKKTGEHWHITAPLKDLGDPSMVASAVSTLASAKRDRLLEEAPEDLSKYGLDSPRIKLRIRKNSTDPFEEVLLGSDTPTGYNLYVIGAKGKQVYITNRSIRNSFSKPVKDYRNKKIVDLKTTEISELDIRAKGSSFLLKKEAGDKWMLARSGIPAEKAEVQKTLSAIVGLRAKEYASETGKPLSRFGLSRPAAKFNISVDGKKEKTELLIGKVGKTIYAKRADKNTIYEVDVKTIDTLGRRSSDYRGKTLAEFNRFKVSSVSLDSKTPLKLKKEGEEWKMEGQKDKLDKAKVESLLARLQDTKILRYASPSDSGGTKSPKLKVSLADAEGKTLLELSFGNTLGNQIYVARQGLSRTFLIKRSDFNAINLKQADLVTKPKKKAEQETKKKT